MQPHMQAVRRRQPHAQVGGEGITSKSKDTLASNGLTTTVDNNGAALEESREWTDNEEELLENGKGGEKKAIWPLEVCGVLGEQMYTYPDTNAVPKPWRQTKGASQNRTKENMVFPQARRQRSRASCESPRWTEFSKNCHQKIWLRVK